MTNSAHYERRYIFGIRVENLAAFNLVGVEKIGDGFDLWGEREPAYGREYLRMEVVAGELFMLKWIKKFDDGSGEGTEVGSERCVEMGVLRVDLKKIFERESNEALNHVFVAGVVKMVPARADAA